MDFRPIHAEDSAVTDQELRATDALRPEPHLRVNVLLGMPIRAKGPAYTAVRIAETLRVPGIETRLFGQPNIWPGELDVPVIGSRPFPGVSYVARSQREGVKKFLRGFGERDLRAHLNGGADGQIVYTWGEVSLELARDLKARGVPVVREKINCAKATSRRILLDAYAPFGTQSPFTPSEQLVEKEAAELLLADAIFCPSPMVGRSLMEVGIPEERLIPTSYGFEPARFVGTDRALPEVDGPTFLFVGFVCVRKGAHILLEAWEKAGCPGRLVLVGDIEPVIAKHYAHILARESVCYFPYTAKIGAMFRSADWFVFPSLEEGGPQVTYEAAGCGIPAIVSEMGAGAFTRDGLDGEVLRENSVDAWVDALVRLGPDRTRRDRYAESARARSADFTWERVGARRGAALLSRFG